MHAVTCCSYIDENLFIYIVRQCILSSFVGASLFTTLLLVGGLCLFFMYRTPALNSVTVLGHRNDTILLKSGVDSFSYSNVTVRQCILRGDDYHDASVYVVKSKNVVTKTEHSLLQFPKHFQDTPSYKSGIQDYQYLLPNSSFIYRVCLSSSAGHDQDVTFLVFDNAISYGSYVNDQQNGEVYSSFYQTLIAPRNNRSTCSEISYNITHPSYYFIMMRSPGNISYSYNFTVWKVAYNIMNAKQYCHISDMNNCNISLTSDDFKHSNYDILAHIQPGYMESSIVTHFCVLMYGGSATLKKLSYISGWLLGVGGALSAIIVTLLVSAFLLLTCKKHQPNEERQHLLHHY